MQRQQIRRLFSLGRPIPGHPGMYGFIFSTVEQSRILQTVLHIYISKKYGFIVLFDVDKYEYNVFLKQESIYLTSSYHERVIDRFHTLDRMVNASSACHLLSPTFFAVYTSPLLSPSNFFGSHSSALHRDSFATVVVRLSRKIAYSVRLPTIKRN